MPLRDRDGQPGADDRPLPRAELHTLAAGQIEAGVTDVGTGRDDGVLV
jgi:hypothetical protein